MSLLGLLITLLDVTGSGLKPESQPERAVNPVPKRLASTAKAERILGFKAKVGLDEGLRRLIGWRKDLLEKVISIS